MSPITVRCHLTPLAFLSAEVGGDSRSPRHPHGRDSRQPDGTAGRLVPGRPGVSSGEGATLSVLSLMKRGTRHPPRRQYGREPVRCSGSPRSVLFLPAGDTLGRGSVHTLKQALVSPSQHGQSLLSLTARQKPGSAPVPRRFCTGITLYFGGRLHVRSASPVRLISAPELQRMTSPDRSLEVHFVDRSTVPPGALLLSTDHRY